MSFENPCLYENEINSGVSVMKDKKYKYPLVLCFVGRIDSEKGVGRIIEALTKFPKPKLFKEIHFVGDGIERNKFEKIAKTLPIPYTFHGALEREKIIDIYKKAHLLLLPSVASEGFPKVIAEAANFGCIPVVSDISSIGHYISEKNGYIWHVNREKFSDFLKSCDFSQHILYKKALNTQALGKNFSYNYYSKRIFTDIIKSEYSPIIIT